MSYRALASSRLAFAYEDNDTLDGDPRDSLEELTITLAPGLVAALASVPATCSDAQLDVADCPDAAVIGDGVAHLDGVRPLPATLYLLDLPPTVVPIAGAVAACLNGTSCVSGSVTATSPLVTGSQLRRGAVTLAGSGTAPTVTLEFPEPAAFKITGTVDIASGIVTFADVPDLPFTEITVHVTGTSAGNLLAWTCTSGDLYAVFMPHSGGDDVTGRLSVAPAVCPDVVKPRPPRHPRLRVAIAARRALATGRRATLPLTCRGGRPRAVCRGTLSLTQRKRTVVRRRGIRRVVVKTVVLARANYGVRTGVTRRITLRLTNSGARMLASAKRGRLSVRATATLKGGRTAQRVITLQRGSRAR